MGGITKECEMLALVILVVHLSVHSTMEDGFLLVLHHGALAVLDSSDQEFILEFLISPTGLHQLSNNTHQLLEHANLKVMDMDSVEIGAGLENACKETNLTIIPVFR